MTVTKNNRVKETMILEDDSCSEYSVQGIMLHRYKTS